VIGAALAGGVRAVQLRERDLTTRALLALAHDLRTLTAARAALLLINDRIDVALACEADGVHLPGNSFAVADARALLGPERLIGVSTHGAEEVAAAAAAGADFAVFGPVFETPSKRDFGPPRGLDELGAACAGTRMPVLAIGGIDAKTAAAVRARGAAGVAVIRAILSAGDPALAARTLLRSAGSVGSD
jgi:thiamine-phosphate pyrophosphorylase